MDQDDEVLARWCALAPEKSARGCELTIAALGATAGSRDLATHSTLGGSGFGFRVWGLGFRVWGLGFGV